MEIKNKIIALLYHEIIRDFNPSGFQNKDNLSYKHDEEVFKSHIQLIKNLIKPIENEMVLTFDDGGISNLIAAEILEKNKLNGIFFITTCLINKPFFLSKENIIELNKNHTIGSHSHTHPLIFRELSYQKMLEEWRTSKQILEDILQKNIDFCSIPGGDADKKTYESAIESGFKYIFDSEPEPIVRQINDVKIIGRFSIKKNTTLNEIEKIITYKNHLSLKRIRAIKKIVKKLIFPIHSYNQNKKNVRE